MPTKAKATAPAFTEDAIRQRAYLMWEADGRPDGMADHYWLKAMDVPSAANKPKAKAKTVAKAPAPAPVVKPKAKAAAAKAPAPAVKIKAKAPIKATAKAPTKKAGKKA